MTIMDRFVHGLGVAIRLWWLALAGFMVTCGLVMLCGFWPTALILGGIAIFSYMLSE